jgi:putative membrane protein
VIIPAGAIGLTRGVLAQGTIDVDRDFYGPHMMWGTEGWYGMIFGLFFMILGLAAAIAVVVLLVRWASGAPARPYSASPADRTPLEILKERFARGEIDKDEYEERRHVLGG